MLVDLAIAYSSTTSTTTRPGNYTTRTQRQHPRYITFAGSALKILLTLVSIGPDSSSPANISNRQLTYLGIRIGSVTVILVTHNNRLRDYVLVCEFPYHRFTLRRVGAEPEIKVLDIQRSPPARQYVERAWLLPVRVSPCQQPIPQHCAVSANSGNAWCPHIAYGTMFINQ
jgi:hypothetical protein